MDAGLKRHVVLLGLPGSGKSTVGRLAAKELGSGFADVDDLIERATGRSISTIFEQEGEVGFRARERATMMELLAQQPAVIAPGGGWAAWGDNLADARGRAFYVYLRTTASVAAQRTEPDASRPLLTGDREARMGALLAERAPHYDRADVVVEAGERAPVELAREVARLARALAGW